MKRALVDYRTGLTPQLNQEPDIEKGDPKLFDYTWNPWLNCLDATCSSWCDIIQICNSYTSALFEKHPEVMITPIIKDVILRITR